MVNLTLSYCSLIEENFNYDQVKTQRTKVEKEEE